MEIRDEFEYTKEHEWVNIEENVCTVGITDYAQDQLTDIVFVELPKVGDKIEKDKSFAVVESVKSVSEIYAPLSGEIIEVNSELEDAPELMNEDPFGKGWIAKISIENEAELDDLLSAKEYEDLINE